MLDINNTSTPYDEFAGSTAIYPLNRAAHRVQKQLSKTDVFGFDRDVKNPLDENVSNPTTSADFVELLTKQPADALKRVDRLAVTGTGLTSIYFRDEPISDELRQAVRLLDQGRRRITGALESLEKGDRKESDVQVMDFKEFLPELFCLRTISEAFGAVINSVTIALNNRRSVPLERIQLLALDTILQTLMREPSMTFEQAVTHVMTFEDAGFVVESATLESLLDLVLTIDDELPNADAQK
jgi:hypothetical protein